MDRLVAITHGGNGLAAGAAMFVVLGCGSLWPHRAGHSLSLLSETVAVWIPRTKLPKNNEEEEAASKTLLLFD